MGLFDSIKNMVQSEVKQTVSSSTRSAMDNLARGVKKSVHNAVTSKSVKFTFNSLPTNLAELQALPEAKLDTPFKTAALTIATLCNFGNDPDTTFAMLDFLKGPGEVNDFEKQFIAERLDQKNYKPFSFFQGANPKNGYKPNTPYVITVSDNEYSYKEANWATMYVQSFGSDSHGNIKLRKKPSTGQWFVADIQCLSDIRIPESEDSWA